MGFVLLAAVRAYVQPAARLIIAPPLAFAVLIAAISPAGPPPGPEQGTVAPLDA